MTLDPRDDRTGAHESASSQNEVIQRKLGLARADGLRKLVVHLDNCHAELLIASHVELVDEVVADEFIMERIRLALAEVAELRRLVAWKRLAEDY